MNNTVRRFKNYVFDDILLVDDGITKAQMLEIYEQLPADARIVQWGHYVDRAISYFRVESDTFTEVPEAARIPEEVFTFKIEQEFDNRMYHTTYTSSNQFGKSTAMQNLVMNDTGKIEKRKGLHAHLGFDVFSTHYDRRTGYSVDWGGLGLPPSGKSPLHSESTFVLTKKVCECGKEKHGFASHSDWCGMYEKE